MPPSVAIPNNNNNRGGSNTNNNNGSNSSAAPSRGGGGRPSDGRRQRLNDELSVPVVSNFFPIERYYEAAQKVYNMVLDTYEADLLDDTYLYGKRYCTFVLDAIPKHNYYNSKQDTKYKQYKVLHTKQVTVVLDLLEQVATKMDAEEIQKQKEYEIAIAKQQLHDAQIAQEKINQFQLRMQQQQQQQQNKKGSSGSSELTAQSALSKLALLQQQQQPKYDTNKNEATSSTRRIRQDPSGLGDGTSTATSSSRTRYKLSFSDEDDSDNDNDNNTLPPPLLPPPLLPPDYYDGTEQLQPPPPPYTAVASSSSSSRVRNKDNGEQPPTSNNSTSSDWKIRLPVDDDNNNDNDDDGCNNKNSNSYDGNHYRAPTTNSNRKSSSKQRLVVKQPIIPMKTLQQQYYEQYVQYQKNGRISVSYLDTYQGRNYDSTNGCTVISALVAAYHLRSNTTTNNNNELPNNTICTIIDQKCGPILREIRTKLDLSGHALIIPSDVHDHFVDAKIFTQNQFVGAAGGNICDRNHYGEFLKLLYFGSDSNNKDTSKKFQKASATLFFREHVISIIKIPIISSSSNSTTKNNNTNSCYYDLIDSLPGGSIGKATRTRCTDMQSLECLLQYYTTRKFSDSNCSYIDKNPWDDTMADIDPRVFQGFVWAENTTTPTTNSQ